MATGSDLLIPLGEHLDDLLRCNICLETLKEPKLLSCLHAFCKSCFYTYLESSKKKEEILCPICHQPDSPEISEDEYEIVDILPTYDFIVSLLKKLSLAKLIKNCDSCKFHGHENTAVFWCYKCDEAFCEHCTKCHKGFKMTVSHELIPIADIYKNRDRASSKVIFCEAHHQNVVQVYCVEHKQACCALCVIFSHRKCEQIIPIEEVASDAKQKQEVTDLLEQINENIKLLSDVIYCREENKTNIKTETIDIENTLIKMIKQMKDHLDELQNQMLTDLKRTTKHMSIKVERDIDNLMNVRSRLQNFRNILSVVVQQESEQLCFEILNEIAPKVEIVQEEITHALKEIRNVSIQFEESKNAKEFERIIQYIGNMKIDEFKIKTKTGKLTWVKDEFRNGEIKIIRTIDVAPSGHISGIFLDGLMLFTASDTRKLVQYNQSGELLGDLSVPSTPKDLCHVSGSQVVVSSDASVLYIVDCKDMALLKTMELSNVPVYGVCVFNSNQFLIGSYDQLTWINQSSGKTVKSISTKGESHFVLSPTNNDYICGDGENSISYATNDTQLFTYTNKKLRYPRGIGIDDEKHFYLTGYFSNNIHQITDKGELIRIIPAVKVGIEKPWTLRFEPGSDRFLVTCCDSGKATLCEKL